MTTWRNCAAAGMAWAMLAAWPGCRAADIGLRIASDDWCPFVCSSANKISGGFLVDLTLQAMAASGYRVEPVLMPLNRAIASAERGQLAGVYAPPLDKRLNLTAPVLVSRACFYTRADSQWRYGDTASLAGKVLGVIDDYGYDDGPMDAYLAGQHDSRANVAFNRGEQAGVTNLRKLVTGRYPVALEHEAVALHLIRENGWEAQLRQAGCLEHGLPLVIGFARDDARSAAWVRAFNEGVQAMARSGKLRALQLRYAIPSANATSGPPP